jgi:Uma2 family endonuclease
MATVARTRPRRPRTRRTIGPADHGRRISFGRYLESDSVGGWIYELARGVIVVTEIPAPAHGRVVARLWKLFLDYADAHPGVIQYQGGGQECRILAPGMKSDRHPDHAIYLDPQPPSDQREVWTTWIPHLVVEVVSKGGVRRDYVEKAEEYLRFGVREYWVLDPDKRQMLVHRRAGDTWRKQPIPAGKTYRPTLLPGLLVRPGELLGNAP